MLKWSVVLIILACTMLSAVIAFRGAAKVAPSMGTHALTCNAIIDQIK